MRSDDATSTGVQMRRAALAVLVTVCSALGARAGERPIKVFILAGDENMLEQGAIEGAKEKNAPGSLRDVIARLPRFAFLKTADGTWAKRDDVVVYDAHPNHNNTVSTGRFLQVGGVAYGGRKPWNAIGPDLMFGHIVGDHFAEPVLLIRFAVRHGIWFLRGSRSLAHDYRSPSRGGGSDHDGSWDVIHFNWGVHDTAYRIPGKYKQRDKIHGKVTTPIDQYEKNLRKLVARLKQTKATLIWASTTPLPDGTDGWFKGDAVKYNAVAAKIMKENGIAIDDLYAEARRQGYPKRPNVHSVGNLAPKVIETIQAALAARTHCTKPLPRVLLIGDSITGSYQKQVIEDLDGKAYVCKNPGNAEHTGTGLAKIDEWLDLKQYLLNGQEYLELVNGAKRALANPKEVYPGYKGQRLELAGLVWFQGIADSTSAPKAAEYEKNLACLIRDLRKDLKAPKLPVVVAAVGFGGKKMRPNALKVHDAQMAVAKGAKYPEFAGNVKSIDTRAFWRDSDASPRLAAPNGTTSRHPMCYHNNAETFLLIGEAMGKAMLDLMEGKK